MYLEIRGLTKKYATSTGEITALDGVSLNIARGDFVAVMGGSGSGKSTLLNMIGGLDIPDGGSVMLDGVDITQLSENKKAELRRKKIGVVYQFYNLIPELNVSENITLPTELCGEVPNKEWLNEILNTVGLCGREQAYPGTLSGGQQQRAAIARALYSRPELILADEPTGNLDSDNSAEVMGLLKYMNDELSATVIVVTHSKEVAGIAKRLITIQDGRITADRRQDNVSRS